MTDSNVDEYFGSHINIQAETKFKESELTLDEFTRVIYSPQTGFDYEKIKIGTKKFQWAPFNIVSQNNEPLIGFRNVEVIITEAGRAVVGGELWNYLRPSSAPIGFTLNTAAHTQLALLEPFKPGYYSSCSTNWIPFSWVGDYDNGVFSLVDTAAAKPFFIGYRGC